MQNWDDIRFFLMLCRTRSFVGAGRKLKVTHSTVSRRIAALEASLRTQLFYRNEKGCRLTPEGEKLLPYAEQMESMIIGLLSDISGWDSRLSGSIRIGAPDGLGNFFLAPWLSKFQSMNPAVEIELIAVPMYYNLVNREIDILITTRKLMTGSIVARKLSGYKCGLFATKKYLENHPPVVSREGLEGHRMIGYIEDLLYDEELKLMRSEILPGIISQFRSSTIIGQKNSILADNGIGALPYYMAHGEPTLVCVLPGLSIYRDFWIQINPDSKRIARVRAMIDFIVKEMEANQSIFLEIPHSGK